MGVDHGRGDVLVAEEFLDRAEVAAVLEPVGGEGMAEGVAGGALRARAIDLAKRVLSCGIASISDL